VPKLATFSILAQLDTMLQIGKYTLYHVCKDSCNLLANIFFEVINGARLVDVYVSLQ
jgi:hypothetical protein